MALSVPNVQGLLGERGGAVVASLQESHFNQRDQDLLERGYYESLLEPSNFTDALWQVQVSRPKGWDQTIVQAGAAERTGDLLRYRLVPDVETTFKQARLSTNRWGMRDRDYEQAKPAHTYRIALLGASDEMGWGVNDGEVIDEVAEQRLNEELPGKGGYDRYEILNFAVSGYALPQNVIITEDRVLDFEPDVLLYMAHANYAERLLDTLTRTLVEGADLRYEFLRDLRRRAGVEAGMDAKEAERRFHPFVDEIIAWGYRRIVEDCRARGVTPVWVFLPRTYDSEEDLSEVQPHLEAIAREAGFVTLSLDQAYRGRDTRMLQLAPWDKHPNAGAHRLLGEELARQLLRKAAVLNLMPAGATTAPTADVETDG